VSSGASHVGGVLEDFVGKTPSEMMGEWLPKELPSGYLT